MRLHPSVYSPPYPHPHKKGHVKGTHCYYGSFNRFIWDVESNTLIIWTSVIQTFQLSGLFLWSQFIYGHLWTDSQGNFETGLSFFLTSCSPVKTDWGHYHKGEVNHMSSCLWIQFLLKMTKIIAHLNLVFITRKYSFFLNLWTLYFRDYFRWSHIVRIMEVQP